MSFRKDEYCQRGTARRIGLKPILAATFEKDTLTSTMIELISLLGPFRPVGVRRLMKALLPVLSAAQSLLLTENVRLALTNCRAVESLFGCKKWDELGCFVTSVVAALSIEWRAGRPTLDCLF
jgi:hypothetical protein